MKSILRTIGGIYVPATVSEGKVRLFPRGYHTVGEADAAVAACRVDGCGTDERITAPGPEVRP